MDRRLVSSGAAWERSYGYSRAVVAGGHVYVSGTAPIPRDGSPPPEHPYEQARLCLDIVLGALAEAGAGPEDVVRTRIFLTRREIMDDVGRAHGEVFGEVRPATSAIVVVGLLDPRWLVEIEADALLPKAQRGILER